MTTAVDVFETEVQVAVSRSVSLAKPLTVFVIDDDQESSEWISHLFGSDKVADLLRSASVNLQLKVNSNEANQFSQIFPISVAPSVYVIKNGSLADYFDKSTSFTCDSLYDRLSGSLLTQSQDGRNTVSATDDNVDPNGFQNAVEAADPNPPAPASLNTNQSPTPVDTPPPAQENNHITTVPSQQQQSPADTYKQRILRERKQRIEERERIKRLIKADRVETTTTTAAAIPKTRNRHHRRSSSNHSVTSSHEATPTSHLSFKLFDGHVLKSDFPITSTLCEIRSFVDKNRTDGHGAYLFAQRLPPKTFSQVEEKEQSLADLQLTPNSALILKPRRWRGSAKSAQSNSVSPATTRLSTRSSRIFTLLLALVAYLLSLLWAIPSRLWGGLQSLLSHFSISPTTTTTTTSQGNTSGRNNTSRLINNPTNNNRDENNRETYNGNTVNVEDPDGHGGNG